MMCASCNATVPDGVRFCPRCGRPVPADDQRSGTTVRATPGPPSPAATQTSTATVRQNTPKSPVATEFVTRGPDGPSASSAPHGTPARVPATVRPEAEPVGNDANTGRHAILPRSRSSQATTPHHGMTRRTAVAAAGLALGVAAGAVLALGSGLWNRDTGSTDDPIGSGAASPTSDDAEAAGDQDEQAEQSAAYGLDEPVIVTRLTRIAPENADETPVKRYTVRVREAIDASGADLDVFGLPSLEVQDDGNGFALSDVGELEDGTWYVTVTPDDGDPIWLAPLVLTDDQDASTTDRATFVLPQTPEARLGKWAALLEVIRDTAAAHGQTVLKEDGETVWVEGLSVARTIDLGDGNLRLVVAYPTKPLSGEGLLTTEGVYAEEVWEYDSSADEARQVLSLQSGQLEGGYPLLAFSDGSGSSGTCIVRELHPSDASWESVYYGLSAQGSPGVLLDARRTFGATSTYSLDGTAVDEDSYYDAISDYGYETWLLLATSTQDTGSAAYLMPEDVAQEAQDTAARLESLAGDLLDAHESQAAAR